MDPPSAPNGPKALVAAGRSSSAVSAPSHAPTDSTKLPDLDDRLATPGAWEEVRDGVVFKLAPADYPHAKAHSRVAAVVDAVVRKEYETAIDMLTRTSLVSDFAPDVSIFPRARDAQQHRQMTEVAIEIADSQTRNDARWKAEKLIERGCRRVFLLDVDKSVLCEYDHTTDNWRELPPDALIEDRAFATPILASNLLDKIMNDALILNALRAKNSAALAEILLNEAQRGEARGEARGQAHGKVLGTLEQARRSLYRVLNKRFNITEEPRIEACTDVSVLEQWLDQAISAAKLEDVFV